MLEMYSADIRISSESGQCVRIRRKCFWCRLTVEERLKDDDLVPRLKEAHERGEHALVRARGDGDFSLRVELTSHEGGVCVRNGLLQARASLLGAFSGGTSRLGENSWYLRRRILIAFHSVQRLSRSVQDEFGWLQHTVSQLSPKSNHLSLENTLLPPLLASHSSPCLFLHPSIAGRLPPLPFPAAQQAHHQPFTPTQPITLIPR